MKTILILILSFLSVSVTAYSGDTKAFQIYTKNGNAVDFKKVVKQGATKKYIFFGEYHNNPISHWLQFELTKEMHAVHKKRLVLGAEMFESDNQFILDEYLNGLISSKNFQNEVRLWPNYNTDYKPLVEYAKEHSLTFIATNIPRRYANMVYKKGVQSLNDLSDLAKSYIVPLDKFTFDSTVTCYKELMSSMDGHGGINMATSQAIKDATMAYFIQQNTDNKSVFLHYNGAYHSDNYQGIVHYLKKQVDQSEILTLSTVEQKDINKLESGNKGIADFIICIPETMTKTH
ncbi:MAG: iron-regulated protein [Crocinitomix sp.]|nr:iron-regulated protein [Crocinitomix sp.]